MADEKRLKNFWTKSVSKNWCHFPEDMPKDKVEKTLKWFRKHCVERVNFKSVNTALDWGCGGGLLAKELSKHTSVILLDISQRSMNVAVSYSGNKNKSIVLGDDLANAESIDEKIDMINCYSVIQHFPSYDYWKKVVSIWRKLGPEYITVRTKVSSEIREAEDYYLNSKNFLNALILTKKEIKDCFGDKYKIDYWHEVDNPKHPYMDVFFILKRKER